MQIATHESEARQQLLESTAHAATADFGQQEKLPWRNSNAGRWKNESYAPDSSYLIKLQCLHCCEFIIARQTKEST